MTTIRTLESFSARNQIYVEMLRDADPEARADALAEIAGQLDDELAAELCSLLATSHDLDFRLQLCEDLAGAVADHACFGGASEPGGQDENEDTDENVDPDENEDPDEGEDPDEEEDRSERRFLSRRGFAALQECLAGLYRDPHLDPALRRKILEAAVFSPQPWHEEAVRESWARPEPEWRSTALCCMGRLFPVDFTEEIAEGLDSPLDSLRTQAIVAADDRGLRELGPRILAIAAERGGDLEMLLCAIEALSTLRPPGARKLLLRLRGEPAPVGHFAADALHHLEENQRAEQLIEELRDGTPAAAKLPLRMLVAGDPASFPGRQPLPPPAGR